LLAWGKEPTSKLGAVAQVFTEELFLFSESPSLSLVLDVIIGLGL
jgi:hypothetical protein